MTEQIPNIGKDLNNTFLPSSILRKSQNKLNASLTQKYDFEKTTGNAFISIDPPEIKYAGYELDKSYTATVRIINRAPIPQRMTIIPPESSAFAIKTNKKGSIAAGMSETITVLFRSNEFTYQTDVICIRTETENFVIPLYAYPTLPDLRSIFPKMIDFGAVQCKEPATYYYPIVNSVPIDFEFEFFYQKESQEISINPLKGIIPANETLTVQITFIPVAKFTSTAEVYLQIKQFDFQPLPIKIIGSGTQKAALNQSKRIKSSRLAPLKDGEESRKAPQPLLKRRESGSMSQTQQQFATGTINPSQSGTMTMKKTLIRKLVSAKKVEEEIKPINPAKIAERQYLNKFTRIQDLDKEKQIKFSQYLGDKAMTEQEIQNQKEIAEEIEKIRMQAMEKSCIERHSSQAGSDVAVEFKTLPEKTVTWDDKQNDQHLNRRKALTRFMNAGTKVILKYRLLKRLEKIKDLIGHRTTKQEVKKLVDESHAKALDQQQGIALSDQFDLDFGMNSIEPSYFQLQFEDSNQKQIKVLLKPQGKTSFDDLTQLKELEGHRVDKFKLTEMQNPADYFYHSSQIPEARQSGQEELFYKTSALDTYIPEVLTSAYSLPIKVPAHHFIYDDQKIKRYQNYNSYDEKDPEVILEDSGPIEDEFQGWTGGQFEILKYKFSRNVGCPYVTYSDFTFSSERHPLPPEATLGQGLPRFIQQPSHEDTIEAGDSDEQNLEETPVETAQKFLDTVEGNNAELKDRRAKKQIRNPEKEIRERIEKNLDNIQLKGVGEFIGHIMQSNKWVEHSENRLLL